MKKLDLSLVLPCYREEEIFIESVDRIIEVLKNSRLKFEIIFVEDKSPDNTAYLIKKVCKKYSFCKAIFHERNMGRGRAVVSGIELARGNCVGFIDIDLEVSPVYIPQIVFMILEKKADVVIGKRIYRTTLAAIPREIASIGYKWISDHLLDTEGLDTESGYKFFNRKKIQPIIGKTKHPHWFWDTEVIIFAKLANLRIVEVPVLFLRRTDKQSTVRFVRDTLDYVKSLWEFRTRLQNKITENK